MTVGLERFARISQLIRAWHSVSNSDDKQDLLSNAIGGDRCALERLLLSQSLRLSRRIAAKLPETALGVIDADDVLQETFIQAIRDIRACQAGTLESFAAWLTTIADHRLQDMLKGRNRRKRDGGRRRAGLGDSGGNSWLGLVEVLADSKKTPSQSVARREAMRAVQVAVAALPTDQRQAVRLRFLEGKSIEETANKMQRTPAAVNGLIRRAKQALRSSLHRSSMWLSK
jgi:RNA polymerase sigma-70 factor (ECF subfamily)